MACHQTAIKLEGVSKYFDSAQVLQAVSLQVQKGELVALLGENGAGKTTLISTILGLFKTDAGTISIFGHKPGDDGAKQQIGAMLQSASLPDRLKVIEQVRLFASYYRASRDIEEVVTLAKIDSFLEQRIGTLSGGQKQRLLFALALIGNPDVLILDEPTVGLDSDSRRLFWECIQQLKSEGTAIILTTHYLDEAEALADRVVLLHHGKVVLNDTTPSIKAKIKFRDMSFTCNKDLTELVSLLESESIRMHGNVYTVQTLAPEKMLTKLVSTNTAFSDLVVSPVSLESAVKIVSEQTRGEAA